MNIIHNELCNNSFPHHESWIWNGLDCSDNNSHFCKPNYPQPNTALSVNSAIEWACHRKRGPIPRNTPNLAVTFPFNFWVSMWAPFHKGPESIHFDYFGPTFGPILSCIQIMFQKLHICPSWFTSYYTTLRLYSTLLRVLYRVEVAADVYIDISKTVWWLDGRWWNDKFQYVFST